jgi:hypothetical protein
VYFQRLDGVVLPFGILVRGVDVDAPVARAAESYRTMDLPPAEVFLLRLF